MKKCTLLFLVLTGLVIFCYATRAQVEVTTFDGKIYRGIIVENSNESIRLRNLQRQETNLNKKDIKKQVDIKTTVTTFSGTEVEGKASSYADSAVTLQTSDGFMLTIPATDISQIGYSGSGTDKGYSMLGLTILMPGGVNLVYGYQTTGLLGFRVQAGYLGTVKGIQGNLLFNLSRSKNFEHNLSVGFGYSSIETTKQGYYYDTKEISEWRFAGAFYDLNTHGFFFEGGLTFGSGDFKSPQISIQLGYVYRFNK